MNKNYNWKQLSSKTVFEQSWFKTKVDVCQLPDGRIFDSYFTVEVPNWCNTIIITEDEKIVLIKQYRYPINKIIYELPGGLIEQNENPMQAALREMQEETGYTSNNIELISTVAANPALQSTTAYFYLATNAVKTQKQNFDEFEELTIELVDKTTIKELLTNNALQHGVQVGAIYQALIKLGRINW